MLCNFIWQKFQYDSMSNGLVSFRKRKCQSFFPVTVGEEATKSAFFIGIDERIDIYPHIETVSTE